ISARDRKRGSQVLSPLSLLHFQRVDEREKCGHQTSVSDERRYILDRDKRVGRDSHSCARPRYEVQSCQSSPRLVLQSTHDIRISTLCDIEVAKDLDPSK